MRGIMRGPNPEELLWDAGADVDRVGSEHFCAGLSPIATIDYLVWHVEEGSYGTVVISMTTSTSVMRGVYTRATASALGWAPTAAVLTGSRAKARALRIPPVAAAAAAAVRLASGACRTLCRALTCARVHDAGAGSVSGRAVDPKWSWDKQRVRVCVRRCDRRRSGHSTGLTGHG